MATHLDDEEELQKLKTWWKENWLALVGGLVVGFGAIGAWEGYKNWNNARAETASQLYVDVAKHLDAQAIDKAKPLATQLRREYSGTPYASTAALAMARAQVEAEQFEEALISLSWVVNHSEDDGLVDVARLRKARVLFAQGKHDQALSVLVDKAGSFASLFSELRGDIQLAKGDLTAARSAYEEALAKAGSDARNLNLLQQKLDDLAVGAAS